MKETFRQAVMAVVVNEKNKVLIGSSPRNGGYKFPQGGLEKGETLIQGITRELKEEVGLDLDEKSILQTFDEKVKYYYPEKTHPHLNNVGQEQTVFKIKYDDSMTLVPQDDEFEKLIWINPKDLEKYDTKHRTPAYKKALELCGLL